MVLFKGVRVRLVFGRLLIQERDELLTRGGHGDCALADDVAGVNLAAVDFFVWALVLPERRAFQGDAGKQAAGTGIGENFRAHGYVRRSRGVAALGAGRCGGIGSELYFILEERFGTARVHNQQYEVRGLSAELQTEADRKSVV